MKQLFEVGEVVIRQGDNYPQCNGEYTVLSVITSDDMQKLHPTMIVSSGRNYYELEGFSAQLKNGTFSHHSCEKFLYKKHQPGEMSFKELMSDLKTNIQERIS